MRNRIIPYYFFFIFHQAGHHCWMCVMLKWSRSMSSGIHLCRGWSPLLLEDCHYGKRVGWSAHYIPLFFVAKEGENKKKTEKKKKKKKEDSFYLSFLLFSVYLLPPPSLFMSFYLYFLSLEFSFYWLLLSLHGFSFSKSLMDQCRIKVPDTPRYWLILGEIMDLWCLEIFS